MEILSVDSLIEGRGTGTALLNAAVAHIREVGLSKVSVITTNDNLGATYRHGSGMDDIPKKVVDERCWLVYIIHAPSHGELAQLGERMTGSHEVRGSIPLFSTRTFWAAILFRRLLFNWAYGATVSAGDS